MRLTLRLLLILLAAALGAEADTIVLKSGRRITATSVEEEGDRISYETPAGRMSLRKELVERIERGDSASRWVAGGKSEIEVPAPQVDPGEGFDEILRATLAGGSINRDYLARLEDEARGGGAGAVRRVAMGYHAAAQFLVRKGEVGRAIEHYRRGLSFAPEHAGLLLNISHLYLDQSEFTQALEYLERARRTLPENADVAKLTGWAYRGLNKMEEAVKEWERAYRLRPDADVAGALEKARRDAEEERAYREGESRHFILRYHGEAAPELARELLRTLEQHFRGLESELNFTPSEPVGVVLYTDEAYFDITRSPGWTAAVNDGRLRVPVQGLSSVTSELSKTLKHELTHSFLRQKTRNRCPTWLNEGVAMWLEGVRTDAEAAQAWVGAYEGSNKRTLSLARMEGSWMNLPGNVALGFYSWSLAVVEYIVQRYGMGDLERLLDRLGSEPSTEAAVRSTLRMDYAELEVETIKYLQRTYLR